MKMLHHLKLNSLSLVISSLILTFYVMITDARASGIVPEPPIESSLSDLLEWAKSSTEKPDNVTKLILEDDVFYFFKQYPFSGTHGARFYIYISKPKLSHQVFSLMVLGTTSFEAEWKVSDDGNASLVTPTGLTLASINLNLVDTLSGSKQ